MHGLWQHVTKGGSLRDEACVVGDPNARADTALFGTSMQSLIKNHVHPNSTPTLDYQLQVRTPETGCLLWW